MMAQESSLVGVSLIQVAISLKIICDVFVEAIAATSICQSTSSRDQRSKHEWTIWHTFCEIMSGVKWHTVLLFNGGVEGALHIIDGLRDQIQTELPVAKEIVQQPFGQF